MKKYLNMIFHLVFIIVGRVLLMPTILWRSPYDMFLKNFWQFFKQINKVAKLTDVIFLSFLKSQHLM